MHKRAVYNSSPYELTRMISKYPAWTKDAISGSCP